MTSLLIRDIAKTQMEDGDKTYTEGVAKLKEYFTDKIWDAVDVSGVAVRKFALALPGKIEEDATKSTSELSTETIYSDSDFIIYYYYPTARMQIQILNIDQEMRSTYNTCLSLSDQSILNADLGEFEFTLFSRGQVLLSTKFIEPYLSLDYTDNTNRFTLLEKLKD